ncbi:MAG: SIS domain-containing protein [Chlamydiota bacterium]|jgi:glucosamine--fructose-6-phosphate aminotransferase (isomerizing)
MTTQMELEAKESPQKIELQLQENHAMLSKIASYIKKKNPAFALTMARGSSAYAALYLKYLLENKLGLITSSQQLSTVSIYQSPLELRHALAIAISQSGKSPDICENIRYAKKKGALTLCFVNDVNSPLAKEAELVVPLFAGQEKAVAATKSFLTSLSAAMHMVAELAEDKLLLRSLQKIPQAMENTLQVNPSALIKAFAKVNNLFVLARGFSHPIAMEAALKFKETCSIHAEGFSSAEVLHGPFALVKKDFHALLFAQNDVSLTTTMAICKKIQKAKGTTFLITNETHSKMIHNCADKVLMVPKSIHPVCDPLMYLQLLYPFFAKLAVKKGIDPDNPQNLQKVTETL